jgi:hypothetical protein
MVTSVLGPGNTDEMDVENICVLIDDNNNKNESAKLTFLASMDQSRVEDIGITVEENTCEGGGVRKTNPPTTLSEETSCPLSARGSADEREEGTTGPHLRVGGGSQKDKPPEHPVGGNLTPAIGTRKCR